MPYNYRTAALMGTIPSIMLRFMEPLKHIPIVHFSSKITWSCDGGYSANFSMLVGVRNSHCAIELQLAIGTTSFTNRSLQGKVDTVAHILSGAVIQVA